MKKVITYGTFDLLHYGHIRLLKRARELGDYLIVALSTDEFNAIKGKKFVRYPLGELYHACKLVILQVEDVVNLNFRNYQSVTLSQWVNVQKGEIVIILRHLITRYFTRYNL